MGALKLYLRYVAVSLRGQMQYRASFWMQSIGMFLVTALEFTAVVAMFARFGSLRGWSLPEVALLYGMVSMSFALAESLGRGFDTFDRLVRAGDFDRLLVRPRSTILQVAAREVQLMRIGRFCQGLAVLLYGALTLRTAWTLPHLLLLLAAIVGGTCLFCGLFVAQATMAFWTTESLEIVNTVTYGGVETAQYPMSIYRPGFRWFFTFVVPLAAVNYLPGLAILSRPEPHAAWTPWLAPLVGLAFLVVMLRLWEVGVRHYRSTGS